MFHRKQIYLDVSIKNVGFVFMVEICDFSVFTDNFYSSNKYIFVELSFNLIQNFCTETQKNARRKLLNLRNKGSVFVPNYFYPGKKFDRGRFRSRARQPRLSRERASRKQQNNTINCNFRQASSKHLITLEPKAYLFFSKLLSFSDLFASVAPVRFSGEKLEWCRRKY